MCGWRGGILLFSPTVWAGSGGGEEGHTQERTRECTYPLATYPLKSARDFRANPGIRALFHARCDWTTGVPDDGNVWRKYRRTPRIPLFVLIFIVLETKNVLDYQGRAGALPLYSGPFAWSYSVSTYRPTFFCASFFPFFALSAPPFPRQFSSPKSSLSGTSDLLFLVEKRQPAGAGFWGRFWTRSPHRKKRKILFFWRAKKGRPIRIKAIGGPNFSLLFQPMSILEVVLGVP